MVVREQMTWILAKYISMFPKNLKTPVLVHYIYIYIYLPMGIKMGINIGITSTLKGTQIYKWSMEWACALGWTKKGL
jgi:hypothetical protein